jgi:predicted SAM-dependent methyltransferase
MKRAFKSIYSRVQRSSMRDVVLAAVALLDEVKLAVRHARNAEQAKRFRGLTDLKLNIGSGPNVWPGWVNIDLSEVADLQLDARRPLPFESGSCSLVYAEHFLEHLALGDAQRWLAEIHRVLQPGGVVSLAVPDAGACAREYAAGGGPILAHSLKVGWHEGAVDLMAQLNMVFRQFHSVRLYHEHRYAWDEETFVHYLREAGFHNAAAREFDPDLDNEERRIGSLYVRAER